jgi:hypothetical protein
MTGEAKSELAKLMIISLTSDLLCSRCRKDIACYKVSAVHLHVEHVGLDTEHARSMLAWLVRGVDLSVEANLAQLLIVYLRLAFALLLNNNTDPCAVDGVLSDLFAQDQHVDFVHHLLVRCQILPFFFV